ncbi:helix-turn-helix transcriptional regulator [Streptomyces microflavus]|uniref:helix-turn-helix transcriptional regulator n=1 Tax=Streptomyces microflavus TaxID=1919 RepID=UPI00368D931B
MTSLLERDPHICRLDSLLDECADRAGRAVLVEGPLGTGKTELLRTFAGRAAGRLDVQVVSAGCSAQERALPFGVVGQLFRTANWSTRPVEQWLLRADVTARTGPADADLSPSPELLHTCRELARPVFEAAEKPLLMTVDDIGDADEESLYFLRYLVRHLAQSRLLLLLADGTTNRHGRRDLYAELFRHPHVHRLHLRPLSRASTLRLLAEGLGEEGARQVGDGLADAAGGNPLLLHTLVEEHRTSAAPQYGTALLSCLHRADPGVLRIVQALAVLGEDATAADVARVAGDEGPETVAEILNALTAAGLTDAGGRLRTDDARGTVLADLTPHDQAGLQLQAARLRLDAGVEADAVAQHLVAADHAPAPWGVPVLTTAAEQALLDHRHRFAADCLRLAHRSTADEQAKAVVRHRLAHAEWQLSPSMAARHLAALTAAVRAGHLGLDEALSVVRQLLWHGRGEEAVAVLDLLRSRAESANRNESAEASALRDVETWLAYTHPALARGRRPPRVPAEMRHVALPGIDPSLGAAAALAGALAVGRAADAVGRALQTLREAQLHAGTAWAEEAAILSLRVLVLAGRTDDAAAWSDRLLDLAERREAPTASAMYAAARGETALLLGELATAQESGSAALAHLGPAAWGISVGLPLSTLVLAATRAGEHRTAAKHLTHAVGEAMFQSLYGLHYLYARGHHHLAIQHNHAALADFLSCGELVRGWGLDAAGSVPWRTYAAEAWLRLDNRDQAWRLVHEQLSRPDADRAQVRGPALRLLAAAGPPGRRIPLLTEAVDLTESSGDRHEQIRVLTDLSRAFQAAGNKRRARLLLRQALHVANMCGMEPLARELLSVSGDLDSGGPVDGDARDDSSIGALTESERRVASLAVLGYTNREIALRLYITASTVEQHLTRVYRKLGVRRRKDLPPDLWANLRKAG